MTNRIDSHELLPCKCGCNIDATFRIKSVFIDYSTGVYVCYCENCNELVPFTYRGFCGPDGVNRAAVKAWNSCAIKRIKPRRVAIIKCIAKVLGVDCD